MPARNPVQAINGPRSCLNSVKESGIPSVGIVSWLQNGRLFSSGV